MVSYFLFTAITTTLLVILATITIVFLRYLRPSAPQSLQAAMKSNQNNHQLVPAVKSPLFTLLTEKLAQALPDSVIFPRDATAFKQSMNAYWAQQECEVIPACIVRPRDVRELCLAVTILKQTYDEGGKQASEVKAEGLFAVRGGGRSPVHGAASIDGGVVIDLGQFSEVTPAEDRKSVIIGAGAKWMDVSKVLDEEGLAVVGGRNSAVGVGGLTLGGGLSFFSARFGFVCSNIISYELILASGAVTTASATTNPDLWRALKGGANNFGIVTRFTAHSFPATKIWSGFLYMPAYETSKVLAAFHSFVKRAKSDDPKTTYDEHAAGPVTCFSYIHKLGLKVTSVNLVYTALPKDGGKKWPVCWRTSDFKSLWRLWSTCKVRTLTSATDEMNALNPPGRRQVFATTTIKNDPATLAAAHTAHLDAIASIRRIDIKGLVWTLVLQPLLPDWASKGDANPLGLQDSTHDPLVIVSFTINWDEARDDSVVQSTTRRAIEQIDAYAKAHDTGHRYRYINYCAAWQKPFEGYGEENWRFLQAMSAKYDPEGLFQRGCVGGFKLGIKDGGS